MSRFLSVLLLLLSLSHWPLSLSLFRSLFFLSHLGVGVLLQARIENGVGDLCHRVGGELREECCGERTRKMSVAIVFSLLRERSISSDDVFSFSLFSPSLSDPINLLPYLVGELIRVPLVDRLGGEEEGVFVSHLLFLIKLEKGAGE